MSARISDAVAQNRPSQSTAYLSMFNVSLG